MTQIAYVNGEYCALEQASVPIMDRGFLFADSIYEVIPYYQRKLFALPRHLKRLQHSLEAIYLDYPIEKVELILSSLIEKNEAEDGYVYLQITRGSYPVRHHDIPQNVKPSTIAFTIEETKKSACELAKGLSAVTVEDIRWSRCDIKSTALLGNILLNIEAQRAGYDVPIFVKNNFAIESTSSNLFIVNDNCLYSPPVSKDTLAGITREITIELASNAALRFKERTIPVNELFQADEIWLSSSTKTLHPVTKVNQTTIGLGKAGPYWHKMHAMHTDKRHQ